MRRTRAAAMLLGLVLLLQPGQARAQYNNRWAGYAAGQYQLGQLAAAQQYAVWQNQQLAAQQIAAWQSQQELAALQTLAVQQTAYEQAMLRQAAYNQVAYEQGLLRQAAYDQVAQEQGLLRQAALTASIMRPYSYPDMALSGAITPYKSCSPADPTPKSKPKMIWVEDK